MRWRYAFVLAAACSAASRRAPSGLTVTRGELVLSTDGRVLHTQDLIGSIVQTPAYTVRIDAAQRDADAVGDVWLYRLTMVHAGSADAPLCAKDPAGEEWGVPYLDATGHVTFACTSGAIGKCIRLGYSPARRQLHDACVHMFRADYGGDGTSFTKDGTLIGVCDRAGIHPCHEPHDIEAAWSEGGAVCVGYPRVPSLITLEELGKRYPRFAGHLGADCTQAATGALLFSWLAR